MGDPPNRKIGHFKIWLIEPGVDLGKEVTLKGQFDKDKDVRPDWISRLMALGNPVSKNNEPRVNPNAHLTVYQMLRPPGEPKRIVTLSNQLTGEENVDWNIGDAELLLVPAEKVEPGSQPQTNLEHFKCYSVTSRCALDRRLTLKDQFDEEEERITKLTPFMFCVPVLKNAEPLSNCDDHLAIYAFEPNTTLQPVKTVTVKDQFFPDGKPVTVTKSVWLCVPSTKSSWRTEHQ
jgi:hypothetical protein